VADNPFSRQKIRLHAMRKYGDEVSKKSREKKTNYTEVPEGLFTKCPSCGRMMPNETYENNLHVCPFCGAYGVLTADERIDLVMDKEGRRELAQDLQGGNPLNFPGYEEKLEDLRKATGLHDAAVCIRGSIQENPCVVCVLDSRFMMGSMGMAVGEKVCRAADFATEEKLPLIIFSASGGARMQEGIYSLMQMARTATAISRHSEAGLLYVSVMTHPTTGGVTASFASLGDIILAEPHALIGFAGPRVIEQTVREKLPEGFQRAESLYKDGFLDAVVERADLRSELGKILKLHTSGQVKR
jgi:acetyl-CoA carboxylase carboxyl transferase beta subunit